MAVTSFTVDHDKLKRGVYVSRVDHVGDEALTTFDVRMKVPNVEPLLGNAEIHTMEHLLAVFLRGDDSGVAERVIYIGPMGCRTGFYLIVAGDVSSEEILPVLQKAYHFVADFEGKIPATTSRECGSYLDHNLTFAKYEAKKYCDEVLEKMTPELLHYPKM